jgi:outer membrane murein-binding lipoprotein Lpp
MRLLAIGFALAWLGLIPTAEEARSYCDDPERNRRWESLSRKYPHDFGVQALDALRLGLCQKIQEGTLTEHEAVKILWRSRSRLVDHDFNSPVGGFLDREADRRRKAEVLASKVERLNREYEAIAEDHNQLALDIRELSLNVLEVEEEYTRRCIESAGRSSGRRCQKLRGKVEELEQELNQLQEDLTDVETRRLQARKRLDEALLKLRGGR